MLRLGIGINQRNSPEDRAHPIGDEQNLRLNPGAKAHQDHAVQEA